MPATTIAALSDPALPNPAAYLNLCCVSSSVELGPSKSWNATDTYELLSSNELHVHSEVTNPEGERSTVTMSYSREN